MIGVDESSKLTMVNSAGFSDGRRVVGFIVKNPKVGLAVGESVTGLIVVCSIVGSLLGAGVGDLLGLGVVGFLVGFGVGGRHEVKLKQVIPAEKMQSSLSYESHEHFCSQKELKQNQCIILHGQLVSEPSMHGESQFSVTSDQL